MSRFISLVRILLISSFGFSSLKARARNNRLEYLKVLGIGAVIVVGLTPAMTMYVKLLNQGFDLTAPLGLSGAIISLGLVLVSTMILYFGVFYVVNTFYYASDNDFLLALPLRPWQVLGARFMVVLLYEYLVVLPLLLPPLLIFGVKSGAPFSYWIYAGIGFLLVPLVPLALASLLTVLVMRFTNLGRRKDLFRILGGILVIFLAVGVQFFFQKAGPNSMDPAFLQNLLTNPDSLINVISRYFPTTQYLSLALVHSSTLTGLLNLLYFVGSSLIAVAVTWWVGEKLYYRGLVGSGETAVKRKTPRGSGYQRLVKVSPSWWAYLLKELRLLVRTPAYFMNCVLATFLVPVFMALPLILQSGQAEEQQIPWESLAQYPRFSVMLLAIISGIAVFMAVANGITATSLSREGKQFYISKYIPLSYKKQIQAKLLSGFIFSIIGVLLTFLAMGFLLRVKFYLISMVLGITLVAILPVLEIGLLVDIYRPKLDWDNEQKAVKQNLNYLIALVFSILLSGSIIYPVIKYFDTFLAAGFFMLIAYGLAAIALYMVLMTKGVARYRKLEG
jgi:ABC-2 type transport system permease protein